MVLPVLSCSSWLEYLGLMQMYKLIFSRDKNTAYPVKKIVDLRLFLNMMNASGTNNTNLPLKVKPRQKYKKP